MSNNIEKFLKKYKDSNEIDDVKAICLVHKLIQEMETWKYLATTLTQEHQQSVKYQILNKVDNIKLSIEEFVTKRL